MPRRTSSFFTSISRGGAPSGTTQAQTASLDSLAAARRAALPGGVPMVTLATAHPAKFPDAVERATGTRPPLPARLGDLFERDERCATLPADYAKVTGYIADQASA